MNENLNKTTPCCDECGCCDEELYEVDGRMLCANCLEELGYVRCDECGEWVDRDDTIEFEGRIICTDCVDTLGLVSCDECGEYHHDYDMTGVDGGWRHSDLMLCPDCVERLMEDDRIFYCDDCNHYFWSRGVESYVTVDGDTVCEGCRNDHYAYCAECEELYHVDDLEWNDYADAYFCENCRRHHRRGRVINDYSFKPTPLFFGITHYGSPRFGDPLTFGFELEVDKGSCRDECAQNLADAFDDELYMKNDSSVDFEIVTHPHTLEAYMTGFDFDRLCAIPRDFGYKSHDAGTCGFHIHVGREQLGRVAAEKQHVIEKIILLMHRHWNSLVKFSRRTEGQLSHWASAPRLSFGGRSVYTEAAILQKVRDDYVSDYDRYKALNLCNRGTIEFRLWRGSLKPTTLKATIQLTSNLVRYAMEHTTKEVLTSEWEDIVNFETCPELLEYVESLGLKTGLAPFDYPITENRPQQTRDGKFKVGDRVMITSSDYLVSERMIGQVGVVAGYEESMYDGAIALLLPGEIPEGIKPHDCHGLVPTGHGYWVHTTNIQLYEDRFYIGQRVKYETYWGPEHFDGDNFDDTGTIVYFDRNSRGDIISIGVSIDGVTHGHNLNNHMPADRPADSGWFFCPENIHPIED